jgi:ribose transport system permease protein
MQQAPGSRLGQEQRALLPEDGTQRTTVRSRLASWLPAEPPEWTAALGGAVIVAVILSFMTDAFLTPANLTNVLAQTAVLTILATGQVFVLLAAGIDLSVSATMALAGTLLGMLTVTFDWGVLAALAVVLGAGVLIGTINGILIARFALPAFIVTLGGLLFWRGLALQLVGGINTTGLPEFVVWLGQGRVWGIPVAAIVALSVVVISWLALSRTKFGIGLKAIGGSSNAAERSGVPVLRYRILAYVCCSVLSAIGGIILVGRLNSAGGSLGLGLELMVIAAAAIGGVSLFGGSGSPWGAFFGAILIGLIQNGLNLLGTSAFVQQMAAGIILVVAVGVDQARRRLVRRWS